MNRTLLGCFILVGFFLFSETTIAAPITPGSFSTTWDTTTSIEIENQIGIYLGVCPDTVYWESLADANINGTEFVCDRAFNTVIDFGADGQYRVDISGDFTEIGLLDQNNRNMFRTVEQWGISTWDTLDFAFSDVTNLVFNAADIPDLSETASINYMFSSASNFNEDISAWNTSSITSMYNVFFYATTFNQPLDSWDVSNVTSFLNMFQNAESFNQPLDSWDTSSATDMNNMFGGAIAFNQPLNSWNVSNVTDFGNMFNGAQSFNQPLNNWDVSAANSIGDMFGRAAAFNQDISSWDVSNVSNFFAVFRNATSFNQPLNSWDVSNATNMEDMFRGAESFNQTLNTWVVTNVTNFRSMFDGATAFNQSLGLWQLSDGVNLENIFQDSAIDSINYANTLIGWAALNLMTGDGTEDMGSIPSTYCDTAQSARDILIANSWSITDLGPVACVGDSGSQTTRVGIRDVSAQEPASSTISSIPKPDESTLKNFFASVRQLIDYLRMNEEEIATLSPEQQQKLIVTLRDALLFILNLVPGV